MQNVRRPLIIILIVAALFIGLLLLVSQLVIAPPRIAEVNVTPPELQAEIGASESLPRLAVVATTQSSQAAPQEAVSATPSLNPSPAPSPDHTPAQTAVSDVSVPTPTGTITPFPTIEGAVLSSPSPAQPASFKPATGSFTPVPSARETSAQTDTTVTVTSAPPASFTPVTGSFTPIPIATETLAQTNATGTVTPAPLATHTPVIGSPTPIPSVPATIDPIATPTQVISDLTLWVEPEMMVATTDDLFTLKVDISNVNDLGGFEFELIYDPAVVWVTDVQIGDFLGSTERTDVSLGPEINNDTGITAFGGFTFGEHSGPDGSGELATISFLAQASGSTEVLLKNVQILNTEAALLTPLMTSNGSAVVEAP